MDNSASLNRYAYVQGNPVSLTDPFGLSPDMDLGNYEANALKNLFKVADKVADYLPIAGTARDIQRSYNAFKNKNIGEGIKNAVSAAVALAGLAVKAIGKAASTVSKVTKAAKALKAEKCVTKTAQIASEGIKLAGNNSWLGKLASKAGDVSKKIAKSVKNGVSSVARTVKTNAAKVFRIEKRRIGGRYKDHIPSIPTQQQMHDAVTEWARMENSLADSKRKLDKFRVATVVYDAGTGNYYYGMNRRIKLSGDNLNPSLASWLPDTTLEEGFIVGNCAEVDAVNQALNSGANVAGLYMYTINPKKNIPKEMCENCKYTFYGRVADIFSE